MFYTLHESGMQRSDSDMDDDKEEENQGAKVATESGTAFVEYWGATPSEGRMEIVKFSTKNPLTINVPGERDASSVTKQFKDNQISIWRRSSNRSCMPASFFNALYLLEGE